MGLHNLFGVGLPGFRKDWEKNCSIGLHQAFEGSIRVLYDATGFQFVVGGGPRGKPE